MIACLVVPVIAVGTASILQAPGELDKYGGWIGISARATGFFHVERLGERWWIIDPEGHAFVSVGVCNVSFWGDKVPATDHMPYNETCRKKYGDIQTWARATIGRLKGWGFNTIGAWSNPQTWDKGMAYTVNLNIGQRAGGSWLHGTFPNVFSPEFERIADEVAKRACEPRASDPYLVGYFSDNELRWGPDWRSKKHLVEDFLALPANDPAKPQLIEFFTRQHTDIAGFNAAWGTSLGSFAHLAEPVVVEPGQGDAEARLRDCTAFQRLAAERYFAICEAAIRKHDPNHLILGCRFAGRSPPPVLEAIEGHANIVSVNNYSPDAPVRLLHGVHQAVRVPLMVTEFSFKAMDSGLPNTKGAGRPVATQAERADRFERYVTGIMQLPFVVGYHWFEYCDEPAEGRFDGENSNYGLVNINDEPWEALIERMTEVNRRIYDAARGPGGQ